jgi:hypothetical protein
MVILAAVFVLTAGPALAELQNVQVGGEVRVRYNYYSNLYTAPGNAEIRWPALNGVNWLNARPIGTGSPFNAPGITSIFSWDDEDNDASYTEMRTRLNVRADFTDEVNAYIELDSYDIWGEDFRSDWITGLDGRSTSPVAGGVVDDEVNIYQAYIEANEMGGTPFSLRIGRQELAFGSQWLVGVKDNAQDFFGLSFDAVRLTYATDLFSVDAWAAMLDEAGTSEQDGDVTFYGVYGSYTGIEDMTIDAYYMLVRDPRSINDTNYVWFVEWLENVLDVDDYDVTNIHTIGLRGAGTFGAFDYEAEAAYQWGDAGQVGRLFTPFIYGDDDADYDTWGANVEVGYTFDMNYQPRVFLGYAYLGGEDNRDISWWEWISPFDQPEASVSFNRLFSNWEYTEFFADNDMSNAHIFRGGISGNASESLELAAVVTYMMAAEEFDSPVYWDLGGFRIPLIPTRSYITTENDKELGWELGLYATYNYSEDLEFSAGYAHLFTDDGLTDGQFVGGNGLVFTGGSSDDDADYFFVETKLGF